MNIAAYDIKYKDDILGLVDDFYNEALKDMDSKIDMATLNKTLEVYKDNLFLLIVEDRCVGLIAGLQAHSPINSDKVYQEIMWYVKKSHRKYGGYTLREVQKILAAAGFTSIIMALLHDSKTEKLQKLYRKMGYTPVETHFRLALK